MILLLPSFILLVTSRCRGSDKISFPDTPPDVASSSEPTPHVEPAPEPVLRFILPHLPRSGAIEAIPGPRPWYHRYTKAEKQILQDFNRLKIDLNRGPIKYAESSDDMEVGNLLPNQVTNALIRIARDVGNVDDHFIEMFKKQRKLIIETQAEMKRYQADDSQASAILMMEVIKIIHEAFRKNILDTWSTEDIAVNTMEVIGGGYSKAQ